jgi:phage shock protein PspC (stress-responsive transcriptional regulator)
MKRTVQINLGGVPLTIDDDAYRKLDGYLIELETYFSKSGNQEEIMVDIESRVAELLSDMIKSRPIVEMSDVEAAIKVMGTPTDFDDVGAGTAQGGPWDIKTGKRLFRNPDDKVIGGVCSGLAAYFGIQEVIWIRLAFVLVFLTFGFGVVVYIVMWWLVPEAKTAADRLAMEGEPANARNIGRMVERGIEDLSSTIKHNWRQWHDHKEERRNRKSERKSRGKRDRPVYVFAVFLVPFILVARFLQVIARMIRRVADSRKVSYQKGPFV